MDSFWRALRYTWPYRGRLALSIGSGVIVALFWGLNISAIYPLLTVLLKGQTVVGWVDENIAYESTEIARLNGRVAALQEEIDGVELDKTPAVGGAKASDPRRDLRRKNSDLVDRTARLQWYQKARPFLVRFTPNDSFQTLCLLMALLLTMMVVKGIFDYLQEYLATSVVQLGVFNLRNEFFRKLLNLDLTHFSESGTHELLARSTNDIESLANGMKALYGKVLLEPLKALSCLCFAIWFNWRLTLLTAVLFPLAAVVMGYIGRYLKRMSRRNLESMSRIYKILYESFLGIRIVKAFTMERYERRRLHQENKRYYKQSMRLNRTDAYGGPVLELIAFLSMATALLCGSYLVMTQSTEIWGVRLASHPLDQSMLLTFYAFIAGMCDPLRKVFSVYGRVQRGIAAGERIFQSMDRENRIPQKPRAPSLQRHQQAIEFADVSFGYSADRTVLQGINLRVEFGQTIALVGSTGCGKTSLVNLLPRFYDPTAGAILIDGVDTREVSLRSLRQQIGIVTQQTMLFDDSIFNNIAYGDPFVGRDQVIAAAKAAYAHKFIEQLPQGYDTNIGEMGGSLSGGQRQRIALARAILRDPAILILDEATSSLDVESESLIHKALRTFARGRTTFVVTHRLSVLDIADRIVVVDEGVVEAVGTHNELMNSSPTFRRLNEVQARGA